MAEKIITRLDALDPSRRDRVVDIELGDDQTLRVRFIRIRAIDQRMIEEGIVALHEASRKQLLEQMKAGDLSFAIDQQFDHLLELGLAKLSKAELVRSVLAGNTYLGVEEDPVKINGLSPDHLRERVLKLFMIDYLLKVERGAYAEQIPLNLLEQDEEKAKELGADETERRKTAIVAEEEALRKRVFAELTLDSVRHICRLTEVEQKARIQSAEITNLLRIYACTQLEDDRSKSFFDLSAWHIPDLPVAIRNPIVFRDALFESLGQDWSTLDLILTHFMLSNLPASPEQVEATARDPFRPESGDNGREDGASPDIPRPRSRRTTRRSNRNSEPSEKLVGGRGEDGERPAIPVDPATA